MIRHFRDFMQSAPDELTAYAALLHGLDGSPIVGVIPKHCGNLAEGERVLACRCVASADPVNGYHSGLPAFPAMQSILAGLSLMAVRTTGNLAVQKNCLTMRSPQL